MFTNLVKHDEWARKKNEYIRKRDLHLKDIESLDRLIEECDAWISFYNNEPEGKMRVAALALEREIKFHDLNPTYPPDKVALKKVLEYLRG